MKDKQEPKNPGISSTRVTRAYSQGVTIGKKRANTSQKPRTQKAENTVASGGGHEDTNKAATNTRRTVTSDAPLFEAPTDVKKLLKIEQKIKKKQSKKGEKKARYTKTTANGVAPRKGAPETTLLDRLSNTEKVAYFLMTIPKDEAAALLNSFPEALLRTVSEAMVSLEPISEAELATIHHEFYERNKQSPRHGGTAVAREMLAHAFDAETAEQMLQKSLGTSVQEIFSFLDTVHGEELFHILQHEMPATLAIILANIDARKAATTLQFFPLQTQVQVSKHIAEMREVSTELLQQIAAPIRQKLSELQSNESITINGADVLTAILRTVPHELRTQMLGRLAQENQSLAHSIRTSIVHPDLLYALPPKELRGFLQLIPNEELALFLCDVPERMRDLVFANISKRRKQLIEDDLKFQDTILPKEKQAATNKLLSLLEEKEAAGELHFFAAEEYL